jgi:hypothetical protein
MKPGLELDSWSDALCSIELVPPEAYRIRHGSCSCPAAEAPTCRTDCERRKERYLRPKGKSKRYARRMERRR